MRISHTTKKGTEVALTIGDPERKFTDHINGLNQKVNAISGVAGSVAAAASLFPKRGRRIERGLSNVAMKTAAVGTIIAAGLTTARAVHTLRGVEDLAPQSGDDSYGDADEVSLDDLREKLALQAQTRGAGRDGRAGAPPIADVRRVWESTQHDAGH